MQQTNEITLAICAFNSASYIEETLQCIVNQSSQKFDLLVIDDCSTDNTKQLVESFLEQHPISFELIRFEENKGIGFARHYAERHAKTKYMLFVDADDLPYSNLVEKLYHKIASDNDLMAVGCYLEYINEKGRKIGGGTFLGEKTKEEFIVKAERKKLIFLPITTIYDRAMAISKGGFRIDGFPPGKPRYQDFCEELDLWTRMSDLYIQGKAIVVLPEILFKYRKHDNGLSANTMYMILKMRYVKINLIRRRAGEKELTFIDFYNSLSQKELDAYEQDARAAVKLRKGVFALKNGNLLFAFNNIANAIWINPNYFWQKIKSNSGIFR